MKRSAAFAVAATLAILPAATGEAAAQSFFSSLFGGSNASAYAPGQSAGQSSFFGDLFGARPEPPRVSSGGGQAYCVRLCDGRYFPLPRATHAAVSPAKVCDALCPAAKAQVFHGSDPTQSVAADGTRYANLKNALLYRQKLVTDCSCTGEGPGGLARIDLESDPTLRAGDVVVQAEGPAVFNGSAQFPRRSADFTPIRGRSLAALDAKGVLANLRVDETPRRATPVQSLAPSAKDEPVRVRRAVRPAPRPAAVAGQSFFGIQFR